MTRLKFINKANGIADKRTLCLLRLEAVAAELGEMYAACCESDQDEYQASIWGWIAAECRTSHEAIEEIEEIAEMVKEEATMRPDQRKSPVPGRDQAGAENVEASNLKADSITNVIAMLPADWKIAMRRAHAIRRYKGSAKVLAVRHWRLAVVDALEASR